MTSIAKYESWGGAKDGAVARAGDGDLPAARASCATSNKVHTLWLNDVAILPRPAEVPGAEIKTMIRAR